MVDEYLKNDIERVNKKFTELMKEGEIERIEKKIENLNNKPSSDSMNEIWLEIYNDVLDLKKNKHVEDEKEE